MTRPIQSTSHNCPTCLENDSVFPGEKYRRTTTTDDDFSAVTKTFYECPIHPLAHPRWYTVTTTKFFPDDPPKVSWWTKLKGMWRR